MIDTPPSRTFALALDDEFTIVVPFDPRAVFGKARPPVVVTINGYSYRSTIAIMGGVTFVPLRMSNREAAGVAAGDTIEVTLTLDTAPRTVTPPGELAAALREARLEAAWDALSYTNQREAAEAVESAKKPETRTRRIAATIEKLRG
ncbi:MAG TPA: YdeI/OmpD-associated family protein [Sphingomonas sp.]|nr:YdeI/OmpD-associated family protein [Sphingomonas sp.]